MTEPEKPANLWMFLGEHTDLVIFVVFIGFLLCGGIVDTIGKVMAK